ncbi:hypothetical protein SARC_12388 [Sphaeroforma arctica JP610]|uniref:Uncharacterized protein n=1 Tax=Sphaeroforma arctica JP610 TaxID=667725 RepID=A0A0L0FEB7_9EUKA|nr:hypothetical protein SARC_12388 [Sphaeroforma arctica JP610]KNC75080.1 hypothetical protein SARC_12388 [Sphaeroforma arctica JP610]|eukprot:XP_014148982.1 hypothetical protein SARC_12388 [Sphaeroforma arctica JP610]
MTREEDLLRHYHDALTAQLNKDNAAVATAYTYQAMMDQYACAVTDFYRFTVGWNMYMRNERRTRAIVDKTIAAFRCRPNDSIVTDELCISLFTE